MFPLPLIDLGIAAYTADIVKFKVSHDKNSPEKYFDYHYIIGCICRGCAYSLDFSRYILTLDYLSTYNYKVAVSCLVMHNIIDLDLIEKYKPFCIWYPFVPKKSTCYDLPESMKYSVAILSILMNWKDVYNSLDLENDFYIGHLIKRLGRDFDFDYSNTKNLIDLENETISPSEREHVLIDILLFELSNGDEPSIFDKIRSDELISFHYSYPFGLRSVAGWNIDNYIINKNFKYLYIFEDSESDFRERDIDKCQKKNDHFFLN